MPNAAELLELDDDELFVRLADSRRELLNLRFQLATGQLDNVARIGLVKKDVARILTLLRDREIAIAEGRDAGPVMRPARQLADEEPRPRRRTRAAEVEPEDELDAEDEDDLDAGDEVDAEADDDVVDTAEDSEDDEADADEEEQ